MSSDAEDTNAPVSRMQRLLADLAICGLMLAVIAVAIAPHWESRTEPDINHLHDVATAAGSLQSAASLERAEQLTKGSTVQRDFNAPRTGALKVVKRPIAANTCAEMWSALLPDGPAVSTGSGTAFTVDPTEERGICLYRYTGTNSKSYVISYRPESGKVGYD